MNRQRLFLGTGWKMNKTVQDATDYAHRLPLLLDDIPGVDRLQLFIIPPFTAIDAVKQLSAGRFWTGAQNMHWEEGGAFTGEISGPMLQELGVDLVELGHAERRRYFNETDDTIQRKVHAALKHGFRPLVCVGEQLRDREYGFEKETITQQLRIAFSGVPVQCAPLLMVAYEPVWAIGDSGVTASADDVHAMIAHIRDLLEDMFGAQASVVPVLYGGTVDVDNCVELLLEGHTDGLFVGRAAWTVEGFAHIISRCAAAINHRESSGVHVAPAHSS